MMPLKPAARSSWLSSGVAALLLLGALCAGMISCPGPGAPAGTLLFWGFDQLFVGSAPDGRLSRQPVDLHGTVTNLTDVTVAGSRAAVLGLDPIDHRAIVVLVDLPRGSAATVLSDDRLKVAAISPDGRRLALRASMGVGAGSEIRIFDTATSESRSVIRGSEFDATTLSWHPAGGALALFSSTLESTPLDGGRVSYKLRDMWIQTVQLDDGSVDRLVEGETPAWSPDGTRLAYRRGRRVLIYDRAGQGTQVVYSRYPWQSDIVGEIYWSPDGSRLALNVGSGLDGKQLNCVVVELATQRAASLGTSSFWCGPWLSPDS